MTTTTTTGPTTAPAIQALFCEGLPAGAGEVEVAVAELDKLPSELRAEEVVAAGVSRYRVQALHPLPMQANTSTDDPGAGGLWLNTVMVLQTLPPLYIRAMLIHHG
jgi:hypothetical protein